MVSKLFEIDELICRVVLTSPLGKHATFPQKRLSTNKAASSSSTAEQVARPTATIPAKPRPPYFAVAQTIHTSINIGLMIFVSAVGVIGILDSNNVDDTGTVFVGIYLLIFAMIEFTYEVSQIIPSESLDELVKKNFGFLYGVNGRGMFFLL